MAKCSDYHKTTLGDQVLHPETLMLSYGYCAKFSEGAVKPPVYLASTFTFETAADGERYFEILAGKKTPQPFEKNGLLYSRFNNPNCEIVEDRLAVYEGAEAAAVFSTGMAAISTSVLAYVRPGDVIVHNAPLYGGTDVFFKNALHRLGISCVAFLDGTSDVAIRAALEEAKAKGRVGVIYLESPSNPLNGLVDFSLVASLRDELFAGAAEKPMILCDNTLLGPVYQKPLRHGVDLSMYSATKYIGGHSDLVAGAAVGSEAVLKPIRALRTSLGTSLDPHTAWMISRSLETLGLRMAAACANGEKVATFLQSHPRVEHVFYLGFLKEGEPGYDVFKRQCGAANPTLSFKITGGKAEAFAFLDALKIFKMAVSLGGTESLACHPATTVHSGIPQEVRDHLGITDQIVRLSIGIENADDLIADLAQALEAPPQG